MVYSSPLGESVWAEPCTSGSGPAAQVWNQSESRFDVVDEMMPIDSAWIGFETLMKRPFCCLKMGTCFSINQMSIAASSFGGCVN